MRWAILFGIVLALLMVFASLDVLPFREWFGVGSQTRIKTEERLIVPTGAGVAELFDFINRCQQDQREASLNACCEASDKIVAQSLATDDERSQARRVKLLSLLKLCERNREKYSSVFDEYANKIVAGNSDSEDAAMADAYRILKDFGLKGSVKLSGADALIEHSRKYPKSAFGYQLNMKFLNELMQSDEKAAGSHVSRIVQNYANHPNKEEVQMLFNQLSAVGSELKVAGPSLTGGNIDLASYKGKVVLVDFWGTWCPHCIQFMPTLQAMHESYREQGFEILGVAIDDNKEKVNKTLASKKTTWPQIFFTDPNLMSAKNPIAKHYGISTLPVMFLVGRDGKAVLRLQGVNAETEPKLHAAIRQELAKPAK